MINLKSFFQPNPSLLVFSKAEKELLERFFSRKADYESWHLQHPDQKIRFRFYFPTAMDFFYDGSVLFTAYFKKSAGDIPVLHELKMSKANYTSIQSTNWKPFEEVMTTFLLALEESQQVILVQKTRSLREYMAICNEANPAA